MTDQDKYCPRCNIKFRCGAGKIVDCHCIKVVLSKEAILNIRKRYEGCLCADCLKLQANDYPLPDKMK